MPNPKVSVALPVYNGEAHIGKALEAVFSQTVPPFEVVVLDDGSTDRTVEIAREFDVRLIQQANSGAGEARRRLVEECRGDYIAWVDHDDFWTPNKLEVQVPHLKLGEVDVVHSDGLYVYEDGREVQSEFGNEPSRAWDHILPNNRIINSTAIFSRQAMLDAGNFVAETKRCNDWYGWMLIAGRNKFVHVHETVVRYSVLSTSLANAGFRFQEGRLFFLERLFLPRVDELMADLAQADRDRYRRMIRIEMGKSLSAMARLKLKDGDKSAAKGYARRAISIAPSVAKVWTRSLAVLVR